MIRARLALTLALLAPASAFGQGYPVIDSADIAQAANAVSTLKNIVQVYGAVSNPSSLLGINSLMQKTLGVSGLPGLNFNNFLTLPNGSSASTIYSSFSAAIPSSPGAAPTNISITNFGAAQQATSSAFWPSNPSAVTQDQANQYNQSRRLTANKATNDALALAQTMKATLAAMPTRVNQLSDAASNASDTRGDIQANTATLLAIHDRLIDLTAILDQLLDDQASQEMVKTPVLTKSASAANPTGVSQ